MERFERLMGLREEGPPKASQGRSSIRSSAVVFGRKITRAMAKGRNRQLVPDCGIRPIAVTGSRGKRPVNVELRRLRGFSRKSPRTQF